MLVYLISCFNTLSLCWSQAYLYLSPYEWGDSCYCWHTYRGLLWRGWMLWLRPWLMLLPLLHRELLPKLQSLHLSLFLLKKVPRLRGLSLGNLLLFLPRSPLLKRELPLQWCPRLRTLLLLHPLSYLPPVLSSSSLRWWKMAFPWWSPRLLSLVLPPEGLMLTCFPMRG